MKKKVFPLVIFLILSVSILSLILFFASPSIYYRAFPQALISLRRVGIFSQGWIKKNNYLLPKRMVLGINLPSYSISYKQALLASPDCQEKLSSWLTSQNGKWGVVIYDLVQQEKFSFRSEQKFHAASVMKLATAVSVFDWAQENKKGLDSFIWGQSLKQRLTALINKSDNNQWADLGALITLSRTQKILKENGLTGSNIYTNTMTAEDVFLLLNKIYNRELVNEKDREFLFKIMQNTINEKRIPVGIPEETAVVHKYGTWQGNIHDAGIVFYQNPYILVVLTNNVSQPEAKIADFSSQIYQIFSQRSCE